MGRKGEETRNRLVSTARELFRHQGFNHTSVDDISRAAQVNRGLLYFHFKNKQDLAAATLDDTQERTFRFFEAAMGGERDPLERLRLMIAAMVSYNLGKNCAGG